MRTLEEKLVKHVDLLVERYPILESCRQDIIDAYLIMEESYVNGGKLLIAGNGGSAADAEHIVGELMKGFKMPRKPDKEFTEKLRAENKELGTVLAENLQGALPAIALDGARDIIRGCHNRDKGTAENERLRNPKFIFSYPKNERLIFWGGSNAIQKEISTMRVG